MNKPTKLHLINQNNKKNSTLLNQYDLLDEMTQGKTGTVSLIKKIGTNNLFVLKKQNFDITKITKEEKSRFTNEEKLLKTLHRLEAVEWVTPSERLLIQPYYPTMSLFELSLTKIIVAQEIRVKIVEQCFNKLFELHQKGWIHADLQPSNIIIDFAEKNGTMTELKNMYIIDFGQALKLAKNKEICTIPMNSKINPTYYGYYFYNFLKLPQTSNFIPFSKPADLYAMGGIAQHALALSKKSLHQIWLHPIFQKNEGYLKAFRAGAETPLFIEKDPVPKSARY